MSKFPELNASSKLEIRQLLNFVNTLVFKNDKLADEKESLSSAKNAHNLISAILGSYPYDETVEGSNEVIVLDEMNHINTVSMTTKEVSNIRAETIKNLRFKKIFNDSDIILANASDEMIKSKAYQIRRDVINNYKEGNFYYLDILKNYNIVEFIDDNSYQPISTMHVLYNEYIIKMRLAIDHDIIHYQKGILEPIFEKLFLKKYKENLEYYNRCLHSEGFAKYERYWNYVNLVVSFMTVDDMINAKFELINDIDTYTDRDINNLFASYGLDFFEEIPRRYRVRLLKKITSLQEGKGILQTKGTTQVIINLAEIFGFSDISLFKYYLIKDFERNPDGTLPVGNPDNPNFLDPKLFFLKVPYNEDNLEAEIFNDDRMKIDYDNFIASDPYWNTSYDEAKVYDFNILSTKYLSTDIALDLTKFSIINVYFFNFVRQFKFFNEYEKFNQKLYIVNSEISTDKLELMDLLVAFYGLVMWISGYEDVIPYSTSVSELLYSFNRNENRTFVKGEPNTFWDPDKSWEDNIAIQKGGYYTQDTLNQVVDVIIEPGKNVTVNANEDSINKDFMSGAENSDIFNLAKLFNTNLNYMEKFRKILYEENNWDRYKYLKRLYEVKFMEEAIDKFKGNYEEKEYETFLDYLEDNSPDLHQWMLSKKELDDKNALYDAFYLIITILEKFMEDVPEEDQTSFDYILNEKYDSISFLRNSIAFKMILDYLRRLINIFKAYTVQLKTLEKFYKYYDPLNESVKTRDKFEQFIRLRNDGTDICTLDLSDETHIKLFLRFFNSLDLYDKHYFLSVHTIEEKTLQENLNDEIRHINANLIRTNLIGDWVNSYLVANSFKILKSHLFLREYVEIYRGDEIEIEV